MTNVVGLPAGAPALVYKLPQRDLLDLVATNDVASLLILVRGDNPFDMSPGMELIRYKMRAKRFAATVYTENAGVMANAVPHVEPPQIKYIRDASGNSAVHVAAGLGFSSMIEILVNECGCAVEEYNTSGFTPLHLAAFHGHADCVHLLRDLGADVLNPTRWNPASTPDCHRGFCGRTTLFLAHCAQQATVVELLIPLYREFIDTAFRGQTSAEVWKAAASGHEAKSLSLLLDALECRTTASGALPISIDFDMEDALREALPAVLETILPSTRSPTPLQLFLFQRLVQLGYVTETTVVGSADTVVMRVLNTAQVQAWRVLVDQGLVQPHKCSLDSVHSSGHGGRSEVELRALIEEAKAYFSYDVAKKSYTEKGDSDRRRNTVLNRRGVWKKLENHLKQLSLSPARCPRS
ncbi:putative Ankyrin repeat (3 copies)/Ankyrin repeat [Leishmania shawi]|uniref:Ankyrin repeat (3 copies)/Ankyrin repeat n=1 Tax=Leishmania shawi TaxID=5680 RepID=A0AAW3BBR9_9TRYP